jgi:hypothetical protein
VALVVLYNPSWEEAEMFWTTGYVIPRTKDQLLESGYREPDGDAYVCLELGRRIDSMVISGEGASAFAREGRLRAEWGSPRVVSWLDLQLRAEEVTRRV